jgi:L-idonate 5-dehydrogenase
MKAIVIHAAQDLRIEERQTKPPTANEVLISLKVGGICGSDLHYYKNGGFGPIKLREPMVLGHEVSGEIVDIGSDVEGLRIGQLVAISPSRPCKACEYCLRAQLNHCENMRFYGSAMPFPHIHGAFQQSIVADVSQCAPADGLQAAEAAMAEPLSVSLHAVKQAGNLVGKTVLITGCGPIGIMTILAARRAGATKIIATDLSEFTLEKATLAGADVIHNVATNLESLSSLNVGKGQVDVHFECSGSETALRCGVAALRPNGCLIQLGLGGDMSIPMQALTAKEITLKGSFRFHEEFLTAVQMMQKGLIDVRPFVTHSFPLERVHEAFDAAMNRETALKVQITF